MSLEVKSAISNVMWTVFSVVGTVFIRKVNTSIAVASFYWRLTLKRRKMLFTKLIENFFQFLVLLRWSTPFESSSLSKHEKRTFSSSFFETSLPSLYFPFSLSLSLTHTQYLSLPVNIYLPHTLYISLPLCLCVSLLLSLSASLYLSLFLCLSHTLYLSLYLSLSVTLK